MKKAYIAGPMTPRGNRKDTDNAAIEYLRNVGDMIHAETALREKGYTPFNPGRDLLSFLFLRPGENISEERIKAESMEWLDVCDLVVLLPGWEVSPGCQAERQRAIELGMPQFYGVKSVPNESC